MNEHLELVMAENNRLMKEVKQLRARVAALESSRWWRMHPRFALRRLRPSGRPSIGQHNSDERNPVAGQSDPHAARLADRFRKEVIRGGSFSEDWFTGHIPVWEGVLSRLEGRPTNVLELGSFEGLSACFLLWRLPLAQLTCADTFAGSAEHAVRGVQHRALEERFDRNVELVDTSRVRKIVGRSVDALLELGRRQERFDLIYVDASHFALDVLVDASLAWPLLVQGGIIIFDDYRWRSPVGEDPLFRPGPAIDAFRALVGTHCEVVAVGHQAILRKKEEGESTGTPTRGMRDAGTRAYPAQQAADAFGVENE